jgi:carboxylesterase
MRPWAHYLTEQGWSVSPPLLPGHGTHWRDANRTSWHDWYGTIDDAFTRLRERCGKVFVCGLSMGGGLALRLAEERGDEVAGIVVVNPSAILALGRQAAALLAHVVPSAKAIGNDIAKPDTFEGAYDRTPVRAAASLRAITSPRWTMTPRASSREAPNSSGG